MASIFCLLAIEFATTMPAIVDGEIRQPASVLPVHQRFVPIDESLLLFPIRDPAMIGRMVEHGVHFREPVTQFEARTAARQPKVANPARSRDVVGQRARLQRTSDALTPQPMDVCMPPAGRCNCHICQKKSIETMHGSANASPGFRRRN